MVAVAGAIALGTGAVMGGLSVASAAGAFSDATHSSNTLYSRQFDYADFKGSGLIDFEYLENMYSHGMGIEAMAEEFVLSDIEQQHGARRLKQMTSQLEMARHQILKGDMGRAEQIVQGINANLEEHRHYKRNRAASAYFAPASVSIVDGKVVWQVNDPVFDKFAAQAAETGDMDAIFMNRRTIQAGIPDIAAQLFKDYAAGGDKDREKAIEDYLMTVLAQQSDKQVAAISERANAQGRDPGREIAELERTNAEQNLLIKATLAKERSNMIQQQDISNVNQMVTTGQQALITSGPTSANDPDYTPSKLVHEMSVAQAQANAARDAGLANAFGGLATGLMAGGTGLMTGGAAGATGANPGAGTLATISAPLPAYPGGTLSTGQIQGGLGGYSGSGGQGLPDWARY